MMIFAGGVYVSENTSQAAVWNLWAIGTQMMHAADCKPFA